MLTRKHVVTTRVVDLEYVENANSLRATKHLEPSKAEAEMHLKNQIQEIDNMSNMSSEAKTKMKKVKLLY